MLHLKSFDKIYIYRPFADFRKGINGLGSIVQDVMELDPFAKNLFIFSNKGRDALKVVYWDKNGMAMWHKKLQKGRYKWPSHLGKDSITLGPAQLREFLKGLDPWQVPFNKLNYKKI